MPGLAIDFSLRIVAAAAAVGLVLLVFRVRSGAARHAAWSGVLLTMLTMPVLTAIVPRIEVPVPSRVPGIQPVPHTATPWWRLISAVYAIGVADDPQGFAEAVRRWDTHLRKPGFVLATAAIRDGDRDATIGHLMAATKVPATEDIAYSQAAGWLRPVNYLLKAGERDRVITFLEAFAEVNVPQRARLLEDASAIREGRMPAAYQHMVARESAPGVETR